MWLSYQGSAKGLVFQDPQSSPKSLQGYLNSYRNHLGIYLINKKAFKHT